MSLLPRTTITIVVNDRIRRRKRSYTVVHSTKHDRISSYYLTPELRPYIVVSYTTKYDVYTTTVHDRTRSYTTSFVIVFSQACPTFPSTQIIQKLIFRVPSLAGGPNFLFPVQPLWYIKKHDFFIYHWSCKRKKRIGASDQTGHPISSN